MQDVRQWLEELGLGKYAEAFAANDIDMEVLPELAEDDLAELYYALGCAGYGWLEKEGVKEKLEQAAGAWRGPPSHGFGAGEETPADEIGIGERIEIEDAGGPSQKTGAVTQFFKNITQIRRKDD